MEGSSVSGVPAYQALTLALPVTEPEWGGGMLLINPFKFATRAIYPRHTHSAVHCVHALRFWGISLLYSVLVLYIYSLCPHILLGVLVAAAAAVVSSECMRIGLRRLDRDCTKDICGVFEVLPQLGFLLISTILCWVLGDHSLRDNTFVRWVSVLVAYVMTTDRYFGSILLSPGTYQLGIQKYSAEIVVSSK